MGGKVVKFSNKLGYGFIKPKNVKKIYHYSAIKHKGYKNTK